MEVFNPLRLQRTVKTVVTVFKTGTASNSFFCIIIFTWTLFHSPRENVKSQGWRQSHSLQTSFCYLKYYLRTPVRAQSSSLSSFATFSSCWFLSLGMPISNTQPSREYTRTSCPGYPSLQTSLNISNTAHSFQEHQKENGYSYHSNQTTHN